MEKVVEPFSVCEVARSVWQISDVLGCRCYLVAGSRSALLVDAAGGMGDLRKLIEGICPLPVRVVATHGHYDHVAGAYWFESCGIHEADAWCMDQVEDHASRVRDQAIDEGLISEDTPFAPHLGSRPRIEYVRDADVFDLGDRRVRVVGLCGHTPGSVGYLVEDERLLLSGDAVTPIMCLFFDESKTIGEWRDLVVRMRDMDFDHFMTGHHAHMFDRDDLDSFVRAADFALGDRGVEFRHARIAEFRGIMHFCPCETTDVDSPDFRAVIEKWHELPKRSRRGRRSR